MQMWRLFIVSSNQAKSYTEHFQRELMNSFSADKIDVIGWWEPNKAFQNGDSTLNSLLEESKLCDFAVVFLNPDYLQQRSNPQKNTIKNLKIPSDNCIFELGIFVSALEPSRCFVLSSVEAEHFRELLSDFRGINYFKVTEEELMNGCRQKVLNIKERIENLGHRTQYEPIRLITINHLKNLERSQRENGNLMKYRDVVVNSHLPLEIDINFAQRVYNNITDNQNKYLYFFSLTNYQPKQIAEIFQSLVAVHLNLNEPQEIRNNLLTEREQTEKNLRNIQESVEIYLLNESQPIEFCIHNATQEENAICYLRCPSDSEIKFVEWSRGHKAKILADQLYKLKKNKQARKDFVFRATKDIDIYLDKPRKNKELFKQIQSECLKLFPQELHQLVKEVCFLQNS
jgi:hypothetical protein